MISYRIYNQIAEILLSVYQDFKHHTNDNDQYRFQNIQSFVQTFEKNKIQICAKTCCLKKKFVDRI